LDVRDQIAAQVRSLKLQLETAIEQVFDRIRTYLNNLERPELNYDSIRQDVRLLLDDPKAGFEAMRDRLSQVDRGTLVAILSSRPDISEADVNRIIDQIEMTRNRVLQRAERIQQAAFDRVEQVKREAQRQAEETRKAAASAAWWLFFTALASAGAAALAGAIAVL
ncbi:MAG: MFS transporter, partial [Chloroflexaceae bacterium]|nr:MFS transporter [Chloroflexaceae bacterium]